MLLPSLPLSTPTSPLLPRLLPSHSLLRRRSPLRLLQRPSMLLHLYILPPRHSISSLRTMFRSIRLYFPNLKNSRKRLQNLMCRPFL
ncbi:hypothetical protein D3C80_827870 [compost metagenome]